jgi:hypothetical protein
MNSISTKVLGGAHYVANQNGDTSFFQVLCNISPGSCSGLVNFSSSIAATAGDGGGGGGGADAVAVVAH